MQFPHLVHGGPGPAVSAAQESSVVAVTPVGPPAAVEQAMPAAGSPADPSAANGGPSASNTLLQNALNHLVASSGVVANSPDDHGTTPARRNTLLRDVVTDLLSEASSSSQTAASSSLGPWVLPSAQTTAAQEAAASTYEEEANQLVAMGFPREHAEATLARANGNLEDAVSILLLSDGAAEDSTSASFETVTEIRRQQDLEYEESLRIDEEREREREEASAAGSLQIDREETDQEHEPADATSSTDQLDREAQVLGIAMDDATRAPAAGGVEIDNGRTSPTDHEEDNDGGEAAVIATEYPETLEVLVNRHRIRDRRLAAQALAAAFGNQRHAVNWLKSRGYECVE